MSYHLDFNSCMWQTQMCNEAHSPADSRSSDCCSACSLHCYKTYAPGPPLHASPYMDTFPRIYCYLYWPGRNRSSHSNDKCRNSNAYFCTDLNTHTRSNSYTGHHLNHYTHSHTYSYTHMG